MASSWESRPVKHVLFMTFHLPRPSEPGAARPWEELQLMRELGCKVSVITASTHYLTASIDKRVRGLWRTDTEDGVTIIRTWSPGQYRRSLLRRFGCYLAYSIIMPLASLRVRAVDVVFSATDPPFMTPGAYLAALMHRARLVLDERDIYPDTLLWLGIHPPRPLVAALSIWGAWLRRRAAAVITVSPGFVRLLEARGARPRDTYLITNYFPHGEIEVSPAPSLSGDGASPMIVLYAGGLGAATDVEAILAAAGIVRERGYGDRIRFRFLGAGERRDEYASRSGGAENVEFLDAVPRSRMPTMFAGIHVAIHSLGPQWRNSLSSKIFEYMGHGRPVVFAGEGDIADVLAESGGGVRVAAGDAAGIAGAVIALYDDEDGRREMGERARAYVRERFDRDDLRNRFGRALGISPPEPDSHVPTEGPPRLHAVPSDTAWDAFVRTAPGGEIFHTSAWLRLIAGVYGAEPVRLGLRRDGELVAGIPLLIRRLGPFRLAGSPLPGTTTPQMGPLATDDEALANLLEAFDGYQAESGISVTHLICSAPVQPSSLVSHGYQVEPHRTMVLDLAGKTENDLWKGFKSECRTAIRKAEKVGVEVSAASDLSFLDDYLAMSGEVFAKHGRDAPTPRAFYEELWQRCQADGTLRVLLARHNGAIVSGAMFLLHGNRLYYLDGASYGRGNTLRANNLIHWTILRQAVAEGVELYDMVGADTPELIRFKSTFGSRLVERPRARRTNSMLAGAATVMYLTGRPLLRRALHELRTLGLEARREAGYRHQLKVFSPLRRSAAPRSTVPPHGYTTEAAGHRLRRSRPTSIPLKFMPGERQWETGQVDELDRLRSVFQRRTADPALVTRYAVDNPGNAINRENLDEALESLVERHFNGRLAGRRLLEVGCGSGGFLRTLLALGAEESNYSGVDLMPHLIEEAATAFPAARFSAGSAHRLPFAAGEFDVVAQITVLTSVLDPDLRSAIAREMDRVLRPGGAIIWLDFWLNPTNPEVHGIRRSEIARLFPGYNLDLRQVTLIPPLARYLGSRSPGLVRLLSRIRPLRTHYVGVLTKPA